MAISPFAKLYEPIKNTAPYLERIGFAGKPEVSLDCLKELVLGQLHHIPFEDLDVYHGSGSLRWKQKHYSKRSF